MTQSVVLSVVVSCSPLLSRLLCEARSDAVIKAGHWVLQLIVWGSKLPLQQCHRLEICAFSHQLDPSSAAASLHPQALGFLVFCVNFHVTNTFRMLKNCISQRNAPRQRSSGCDVWEGEGSWVCGGLGDIASFAAGQQLQLGFNTHVVL